MKIVDFETYCNTPPAIDKSKWIVQSFGGPNLNSFEISVIRSANIHGQRSYGWFGEDKLLISHNGGPCTWPVTESVWKRLLQVAEETASEMNALNERI